MSGVTCPQCGGELDTVKDSRQTSFIGGQSIRRRRICNTCDGRETTYEITEAQFSRIKRDTAKEMIVRLLEEMSK